MKRRTRSAGTHAAPATRPVYSVATQGCGSYDEARVHALLAHCPHRVLRFARDTKLRSFGSLVRALVADRPPLVVMEGTGVAGGVAVLLGRWIAGVRYVVSSGDAVAPFVGINHPALAPVAWAYERLLCRYSSGFVGWTPYLVGRALTYGAPRGMTAAGWAPFEMTAAERAERGARVRDRLGIAPDAVVAGIVGSLSWSPRVQYCYGRELVESLRFVSRPDVCVLVVGDGSGRRHLEVLAGDDLGRRVILTGRVPRDEVPDYLAAMDVATLPQSVDAVGSFRYTTKLSEYVAAGLPIVTTQIPLAYDFDGDWICRLPGDSPWDPAFVRALGRFLQAATRDDLAARGARVPTGHPLFDRERQQARAAGFIADILGEGAHDGTERAA